MRVNKKSFMVILAMTVVLALVQSSCRTETTTETPTNQTQDEPADTVATEPSIRDTDAIDEPTQSESESSTQTTDPMESDEDQTAAVRELISPEEARRMLDEEENALLLDVRTEQEYADGHIPGTLLIPITELEERLDEIIAWQNKPVIIYCRSGNRSAQVASILEANGFQYLYDLGGIIDWPYETEQVS